MSIRSFKYYDDWRTKQIVCSKCKWGGLGSALTQGELFKEVVELDCPACGAPCCVILFPTIEESRANWDKVSLEDRKNIEDMENFRADFLRVKLFTPGQLPPIDSDCFTLDWTIEEGPDQKHKTLIKYGQQIVFAEPAFWEGYERFIEVAKILRERYGAAIRDLIPTGESELYLFGDAYGGRRIIDQARKTIFSSGYC